MKDSPVHQSGSTDSPLKALLNSPSPRPISNSSAQYKMTHPPQSTMLPQSPMHTPASLPTGPEDAVNAIKVWNCVSSVSLNCELDLQKIYSRTRNSEYNPSRFHGLVMRIRDPRCTALIFRTGKIVCTGAGNEELALLGSRKFAKIVQMLGFPVRFTDYKIQNYVASVDLRFPIRLETMNQVHGQFSSYEPELFPGLIYRMVSPRVVLLIFVNGKIVFTGAKSKADIQESLRNMYPVLQSFRKK